MSAHRPRPLLIVLAVASLGLFALRGLKLPAVVSPWSASPAKPRRTFYAPPGTELLLTKVVGRDRGQRSWEFTARRINRSLDGLAISASEIGEGRIYEGGKISCTFRAGWVRYQYLTRGLKIGGGIEVHLDETEFSAAEAEIDLRREVLTIPVPVMVKGKEISLNADGLTSDLKNETVTLSGNATVWWSGGTLHASQVTYSVKDGTFTVGGNEEEGVDLTL